MNLDKLHELGSKMMRDKKLSNQDKISLLSQWKSKMQSSISSSILSSYEIKQAVGFLEQISLWRDNLE